MSEQDHEYTTVREWVFDEMPNMSGATLFTVFCLLRHKRPMTVKEISEYTGMSKQAVYKAVEYHAIEKTSTYSPEEVKRIVSQKYFDSFGSARSAIFTASCDWCKCSTAFTHAHHYPIPKSEGGTEMVNICPNCHAEYHALMDAATYYLKDRLA